MGAPHGVRDSVVLQQAEHDYSPVARNLFQYGIRVADDDRCQAHGDTTIGAGAGWRGSPIDTSTHTSRR